MFSSALKSFTSNIQSNYSIAPDSSGQCGPWKIYEAKRRATGKAASVFVCDRKILEPQYGGLNARTGTTSVKAAQQEVIERLRREASSLARLRHPNVLELAEPVEETRNGGLMFATEPVTASLASILADLDERGDSGDRRYRARPGERPQESTGFELDELEIQKGLLQIGKGLEFLHESAGLVHANLTPDAIVINAKGDWKITGMAFTGPASDSNKASSSPAIFLSEVLNYDSRLPPSVQLNLDYTSPDFVVDNNLTSAADMFSLGLLIISLYNIPHKSPVSCDGGLSAYKRIFASSSTVPSQHNNFLVKGKFPPALATELLPRLITRRPAQRLSAKAFQQASYFDNILVSTIRFLDALPAKSATEKSQFLKGLPRIMSQFPGSVLDKKILPALLEEMKDKDLLAPILQNVFAIVRSSQDGKRTFSTYVSSRLRDIFLSGKAGEHDPAKEAGLNVVLENIATIAENTTGKEFHDDILPIIGLGLGSPTHAVVDRALSTLPHATPKLDYTTIKNELFPRIASVFTQTKSLAIKIRGLEAINTLCGGSGSDDGLNGNINNSRNPSAVLDRFTVQEKVVPMLKGIKTKEPAVMMAALKVFEQVAKVADAEYLATDVLPLLWAFALGPLLDLSQFQSFMTLIKTISGNIERDHSRKLQEMGSGGAAALRNGRNGSDVRLAANMAGNGDDVDFESLVTGRKHDVTPDVINDWGTVAPIRQQAPRTSSFASTTSTPQTNAYGAPLRPPNNAPPAANKGMSAFATLAPTNGHQQPLRPSTGNNNSFGQTLQPSRPMQPSQNAMSFQPAQQTRPAASGIDWTSAMGSSTTSSNFSASLNSLYNAAPAQQQQAMNLPVRPLQPPSQPQKTGLDKYESLI